MMTGMLLFLNISGGEILVILVVIYLVFGPKKIPELARMLGKGINELRRATNDIRTEINREISNVKKDINLDIDRGDPLGFKKKMEEAMNEKGGTKTQDKTEAGPSQDEVKDTPDSREDAPENKGNKETAAGPGNSKNKSTQE